MKTVEINKYIVADPKICHGKLTFKNTRVMVWQVLDMLESGAAIEEILEAYPSLSREHIKAALSYATDIARGKNYVLVSI